MTLALFNGSYLGKRPTGIGVVARDLICELDPKRVPLLDPLGGIRLGSIPIPNDLMPELGFKAHCRRLLWTQNELPRILKKAGSPLLLSPLPEAPLLKGIRSVVLAHDLIPIRYPQLSPVFAYYLTYVPLVLHNSEKVLCNSEATAREIHSRLAVPARKLLTIPLGFDSSNLRPLNIPRKPIFLILGRHNPHKNIPKVLEALSHIKNKDIELWIVGPRDVRYTPSLKVKADELGISMRCKWISWVTDEEKLQLLNTCQALIIASLWEGFGLPALEAMACHTPVIASSAGALPEVLGNAGLFVDPRSSFEIKEAMLSVLNNTSLREELRLKGIDRLKIYRWERCARLVEKVLRDIS